MTAPSAVDPVSYPLPQWPAYYADVWARCGSTLRASPKVKFADLRFHKVPDGYLNYRDADGQEVTVLGRTNIPDIYIIESLWQWPVVVRHELLHAQYGIPGHPPIFAHCDSLAAGLIP